MTDSTQAVTSPGRLVSGANASKPQSRFQRRFIGFLIAFTIIYVGLSVRFESLHEWLIAPGMSMFDGEPLLVNFDGYYYLSMARDLLDGSYGEFDELRGVPEQIRRTTPPPLLSVLAAKASQLTGLSLNWVALSLPAVLGVLLAVPVFGLGRLLGGNICGALAAAIALLSPVYVARTGMGWFDTDVLLVTFVMLSVWFAVLMHDAKQQHVPLYFGLGLANWFFALWWWDQAPHVATILTLSPIVLAVVAVAARRRRNFPWKTMLAISVAAIAVIISVFGVGIFASFISKSLSVLGYVTKREISDFPNIGITVAEQQSFSLTKSSGYVVGHWVFVVAGILGLGLAAIKLRFRALYFTAVVGLTLLGFFSAMRFLIFASPLLALGIAVLVSRFAQIYRNRAVIVPLGFSTAVLFVLYAWSHNDAVLKPSVTPSVVREMASLADQTSDDAVIWGDWGKGYPVHYWADRATITDGQLHGPERSAYSYLPYAETSFAAAAHFMAFYVAQGIEGVRKFYQSTGLSTGKAQALLREIMSAGRKGVSQHLTPAMLELKSREDWEAFFFPESGREIYLAFDYEQLLGVKWWYWLATWDVDKQQGYRVFNFLKRDIERLDDGSFSDGKGFTAMLEADSLFDGETEMPVNDFIQIDADGPRLLAHHDTGPIGLDIYYLPEENLLFAQQQDLSRSVFTRLFLLGEKTPYFNSLGSDSELYKVWRVNPAGDEIDAN
ncbi:STT3 domain-containing protein [Granulosicoccaceae sp. 1_MG-2023]|nr:STT3 domain-containing protein [Granulosicoccaceae sp. 1_MG-2023]